MSQAGRTHPLGQQLTATARQLCDIVPELNKNQCETLLLSVSDRAPVLRNIELALSKHPGLLTGQEPNMTVPLQKLCHALKKSGIQWVVLPACAGCQRELIMVNKAPDGGRYCASCLKKYRQKPCASCQQDRAIYHSVDGKSFCRPCWRKDPRSFEQCSYCEQLGPLVARNPEPICTRCYRSPQQVCSLCAQMGRISLRIEEQPVCTRCYLGMRRPSTCPQCQQRRLLNYKQDTQLVCAACAGKAARYACPGCGSDQYSRERHLCDRCRIAPVIQDMFTEPGHTNIPEQWLPLYRYLLKHYSGANSFESWTRKSHGATLLKQLICNEIPLDSQSILARAHSSQEGVFILHLLNGAGILDNVNVDEETFEYWWNRWITTVRPVEDQLLLKRYCRWNIAPLRSAHASQATSGAYHRVRRYLHFAHQFLARIREQNHNLSTYPQRNIDAFLSSCTVSEHDALVALLSWARTQKLTTLQASVRRHVLSAEHYDDEHRLSITRQLLTNLTISTADRLAGLLVAFYGCSLRKVSLLQRQHFMVEEQCTKLYLSAQPIILPDPLPDILIEHLDTLNDRSPTGWVFPGRNPGHHISSGALGRRLLRIGFKSLSVRTTAVMDLSAQLPPQVLSEMIGISIESAVAWWKLSGNGWGTYPALRASSEESPH